MHSNIITEVNSEDNRKKALISLIDSSYFCIDYFENDNYCYSTSHPNRTIQYVEDIAEDYVRETYVA